MGKVLHASGSGYFVDCIQNGPGYWTLEKAMDIWWRIRSWELNLSVTYLIEGGEDSEIVTTSPINNPPSVITSTVNTEEDLVCDNFFDAYLDLSNATTKSGSLYDPGLGFYVLWGEEYDFGFAEYEVSFGASGPDVRSFSIYGSSPFEVSFKTYERPEISFTLLEATFSLEPKEWWSYGGTYNTSTGEPL